MNAIIKKHKGSPLFPSYLGVSIYGLLLGTIIYYIRTAGSYETIRIPFLILEVILTAIAFCCTYTYLSGAVRKGLVNTTGLCSLIVYSGFVIRLLYIIFSTIYMRQNDVMTIEESGHLGYISYVYIFGKPPVPGTGWEFTQPPLWYYLCAIWLRIGIRLINNFDLLLESLQVLSLIFSVGIMIICDRICVELKLSDRARITACVFGAFYPYMIFMSGAINNDCLATFLSMLTILYAIKWLSTLRFSHLTLTAVFFGLSLFAKFSSIVLGPALAAIILITFFKKQKTLKAALEYLSFALISTIIGLSWPIYSRIRYGIPFGYINYASERHVGDHAVWELLFSFKNQLNHYYLNVVESDVNYDFNITSTIIKSGTFGVDNFMSDNGILRFTGIILMWVNILLAFYLVISVIRWAVTSGESTQLKLFLSLIVWVSILLLYGRAIYSAYTCNMELRFMLPAFLMMIPIACSTNKGPSFRVSVIIMSVLSVCMWLMVLTIRDYESIRIVLG